MAQSAAAEEARLIREEGACAPFDLLSEAECAEVVAEAKRVLPDCHWKKSLHEKGAKCREIACDERITRLVRQALGTEDILAWGTYLVEKAAGQNHRWHADVEATRWETINAWIPLSNVGKESYMSYIPQSHRFPSQCQDVVPRGLWECDDEATLAYARDNYDTNSCIERWQDMSVGQCVLKNANCWHATMNESAEPRGALLVQYCSAEHAPVSRLFLTPATGSETKEEQMSKAQVEQKAKGEPHKRSGSQTEVLWDENKCIPCLLLPGSRALNPKTWCV